MTNSLDIISQSLGAATPVATMPRPAQSTEMTEVKDAPEIEDDYQEARANLKELISQAMEYVPEVMELAKQAQSDKMINAAASLLTAAANLNISMSKLSKEIKQAPKKAGQPAETPQVQQITQNNNNVFVGSTEDFLEMMDARRKAAEEKAIETDFVEVKV